jgi:malate permease and related proteins
MELLDTMYNVVAPILMVMAAGYIFARQFKPNPKTLASAVVYVFAPAMVLEGMANAEIEGGEIFQIFTVVLVGSGLMALIGLLLARMMGLEKRQESALMLSVVLFNGASYGFPLNKFALGDQAEQIAIVYFSASVIVANTLGIYLASRGTGISTKKSIMNVIKVPTIYATFIGLFLNFNDVHLVLTPEAIETVSHAIPLPLARAINLLGDAAVPGMLVLLGIQLERTPFSRPYLKPVLVASGTALIIAPSVAAGMAMLVGLSGLPFQVGVIEFAMPTAIIAGAFATEFGEDSEFVTSSILASTLLSVLTLSALLVII